ncbi:hypothetical protein GJ744_007726 [Endocarpon pusillum]|uniref:Protein SYS1 n=1 Tax=Endocarpon pusillum TaxID=364733 RepID=A0A8H7AQM2_9EURO|nr:hypothetical protein GJ744_007726 [Endocarpon pusillum]
MPPRRRKPPRAGALSDLPPLKIIRGIIVLQLSYYVIASLIILFTTLVAGQKFNLALIFDWRTVRGDNTIGWMLGFVWLLVSLFAVIILLFLISRSKLVPDFALTLHFLHLLTTSLYTRRLPTNLLWWLLQAGSAGVMISLGVWACRYREMRPISFAVGGTAKAEAEGQTEEEGQGEMKTDEHLRGGKGRGRTRDEGPSYEMVAVKEENGEAV